MMKKSKYSEQHSMDASQLKQLKELQAENAKLKKMYAELALMHNVRCKMFSQKSYSPGEKG